MGCGCISPRWRLLTTLHQSLKLLQLTKKKTKLRVREKFASQADKLLAHFTNDICSEQECSREGYISAQSIFLYIIYFYKGDTLIWFNQANQRSLSNTGVKYMEVGRRHRSGKIVGKVLVGRISFHSEESDRNPDSIKHGNWMLQKSCMTECYDAPY